MRKEKSEKISKTRNWDFLVWAPDAPEDWLDRLRDLKCTIGISPIHDKDKNADGTDKKPHYHCIVQWDGPRSQDLTTDILEPCIAKDHMLFPIPTKSLRGSARYFWHLDDPLKVQYRDPPICLGGFDFYTLINLPADNIKVLSAIRKWSNEYHIYSLNALMEYAEKFKPDWMVFIVSHYNLVVKTLRSVQYDHFNGSSTAGILAVVYEKELLKEN